MSGPARVQLGDGSSMPFDRLVIATGSRARRLPNQPSIDGMFTLRTLDDALQLKAAFDRRPRVAVIGAGFIGAEVAASARQLELDVTMIEAMDLPLSRSLGPELGRRVVAVHERHGVHVACGRRVTEFVGDAKLEGLVLDDGKKIPCDVAVVGIGAEPAIDWLTESGLALNDGVVCDENLAASVEGIYAIGDVCNWYNPLFDERMRVEHWTTAVEQARHVSQTLTDPDGAAPFDSVPMFWSDQYHLKIQGVGRPRPTDHVEIVEGEDDKLVALYGRNERLVGAVTFNQAPKLIKLRRLIQNRGTFQEALKTAQATQHAR